MRVKWLQKWTLVRDRFRPLGKYRIWSNEVRGEGDKSLPPRTEEMLGFKNWFKKNKEWKKCIIILPLGAEDIEFRIAYRDPVYKSLRVSSVVRTVSQGPFALRMPPEDLYFSVAGKSRVRLAILAYVERGKTEGKYADVILY